MHPPKTTWLLLTTLLLLAVTSPANAAPAEYSGHANRGCEVDAEGSLSGKRSFELEAELEDGDLEGGLEFKDKAARVHFESTAISNVVVTGKVASVQGRGKMKEKGSPSLRFSATLDAAARTFELRLSSGYSASGAIARGDDDDDEIELEGSCPFDGSSTPLLDAPRRVSGMIGRAGGTLASGGLSLTIPTGALSENTTIALTPLTDLADSPLAGSVIKGAKLEPEGLRFLQPAVLSFALPANVPTADVIGFGSAGDGSELHLQPHSVSGGTISLQLWHFSTAGGSSGGGSAAAALQRPISNAERQAVQRIAAAHQACNAEVAQGIVDGPACANVKPESIRALLDWYTNAVRPGLAAAPNALSFTAEAALTEWLAWEAEVQIVFRNDPPPICGALQSECDGAHGLATAAVRAHADRRLDNCNGGTSMPSQLRDVSRMADFAGAGAIDITGPPLNLPDATSGALLRECAHLEIKVAITGFPAIAALDYANTLRGRVVVDVHTGPDRTDVPFTLLVDGRLVNTAPDGAFQTTLTPTTAGLNLNVRLEAEATNPSLQNTAFTDVETLVRPTRQRLLLVAQGSTTVPAGGTLGLRVLVAGDGMTDDVTLTVGGPGSVAPTPVTPNAQGEANAVYTAPSSTVNPDAQVIATLLDGTSASIPITIAAPVTVSLGPTSATLTAGGTQNFTATVTNSLLGVTWSATGGSIVSTGGMTARYVAGSTAGAFSVTATSIADPTKSATATVTITSAGGRVRLVGRNGVARARARAAGRTGFDGGSQLTSEDYQEIDGSDESLSPFSLLALAAVSNGDVAPATAFATADADLELTTSTTRLLAVVAGGAEASTTAASAEEVSASAFARTNFSVSFDVTIAPVPYALHLLLHVDPVTGRDEPSGTSCLMTFRRLSPTPLTLATGESNVSLTGSLSPGRYELSTLCEVRSGSPGGIPAGEAGYIGQLDVGS